MNITITDPEIIEYIKQITVQKAYNINLNGDSITHIDLNPAYLVEIEQMLSLIQGTDNVMRKQAEEKIFSIASMPGFLLCLIQIALKQDIKMEMRFQAVIILTNLIDQNWMIKEEGSQQDKYFRRFKINDIDKHLIRMMIMQIMSYSYQNKRIFSLFSRSLFFILKEDYACGQFPQIEGQILEYLESGNEPMIYTALQAFEQLILSILEKPQQNFDKILALCTQTFEKIIALNNQISALDNETQWEFQYLILKIFYDTTQAQGIQKVYMHNNQYQNWYSIFCNIFDKNYDKEQLQANKKFESIYFKCKGELFKLIKTMMILYKGKITQKRRLKDDEQAFTAIFINQIAQKFLKYSIDTVINHSRLTSSPKADKIISLALQFIHQAAHVQSLQPIIQNYYDTLIQNTIMELVMIKPQAESQMKEDPSEFISTYIIGRSFHDEMYNVKQNALSLFDYLLSRYYSTKGFKDNQWQYLQYCDKRLKQCVDYNQWQQKEAILACIQFLILVVELPDIVSAIYQILNAYVSEDLTSENPFLKMRAIYIHSEFFKNKFKYQCQAQGIDCFMKAADGTYNGIFQQSLTIKIIAAISFSAYLENQQVLSSIEPHIDKLFESYISLLQQYEHDQIIEGLNKLINKFSNKIENYAQVLVQKLVGYIQRSYLRQEANESLDDIEDSQQLRIDYMKAIFSLLDSCHQNEAIVEKLENILFPLLEYSVSDQGLENLDEIAELACTLVAISRSSISENLWKILQSYILMIQEERYPYINESLQQVAQYAQICAGKDSKGFLGSNQLKVNFMELSLQMIKSVIDRMYRNDVRNEASIVFKLMIQLLINMRGLIDQYIPEMIKLAIESINTEMLPESQSFLQDHLIPQFVALAFWYNPMCTFQVALKQQNLLYLVTTLLGKSDKVTHYFERRRLIFGITSLFMINIEFFASYCPILLQERVLNQLFVELLKHYLGIYKHRSSKLYEHLQMIEEERLEMERKPSDIFSDIDDPDDDIDTDDEKAFSFFDKITEPDIINPEEAEFYQKLQEGPGKLQQNDLMEDCYEMYCGDIIPYEYTYLRNIDELKYTNEIIMQIQSDNIQYYNELTKGLENQQIYQEFIVRMKGLDKLIEEERNVMKKLAEIDEGGMKEGKYNIYIQQ